MSTVEWSGPGTIYPRGRSLVEDPFLLSLLCWEGFGNAAAISFVRSVPKIPSFGHG